MLNITRKPLFWSNVFAFVLAGFLVAGLAFGWTNPSATPPGGSGAVTATSDGKVGVGTASPTQRLDINGYLIGRSGFCLGKDDLTVAVPPPAPPTTRSTHSTTDTRAGDFPSSHTTTASALHDTIVSAAYTDSGTLRTSSESGVSTLTSAAAASGITTSVSTAAGAVSTVAYKAVGCRTTWPAPGVGVEKSDTTGSGSGLSLSGPKYTTYAPSGYVVTKGRLAKFVSDEPGKETIGNSSIYDDGTTVAITGDFSITGKMVGGSVPWYRLTEIPKIDCGAGKVLQGVFPTKCVALPAGAPPAPPTSPASCTSSVGSGPGYTTATAICSVTCTTGAPKITSYTGSGTPFVSVPDPSKPSSYACNGKPTLGPSSITCTCS